MTSSPQWHRRYLAGQREQVWHELRQLGSTVRQQPDLAEEAQLVCDEMARRARQNVEAILGRLSAAGYWFHSNDGRKTPRTPYVGPTQAAAEQARWLGERFGGIPMTLDSWVRLVGDVWLVGTHPQWPVSASADPFVIELEGALRSGTPPIRHFFEGDLRSWHQRHAEGTDPGMFVLPLAPDRFHKASVSGGGPYGLVLPDGCVDGLFMGETTMPFVSYLNWVFAHGGFPWPTESESEWHVKEALAHDLLPL